MSSLIWQPEPVTSDLDRIMHYSGLWGADALELRTVGKHHERVPWINEAPVRHRVASGDLAVRISDPGWLQSGVRDRAAWMNEMTEFRDLVAFNKRLGIAATLLGELSGSDELPVEPYRRMCELAMAAGQSVLIADETGRVPSLLAELNGLPVKRAVTTELLHPVVSGNPNTIGLVRLAAVPAPAFDQTSVEGVWSKFLKELQKDGFSGDVVIEFGSDDTGKIGLRLFTSLIRAMRAVGLA